MAYTDPYEEWKASHGGSGAGYVPPAPAPTTAAPPLPPPPPPATGVTTSQHRQPRPDPVDLHHDARPHRTAGAGTRPRRPDEAGLARSAARSPRSPFLIALLGRAIPRTRPAPSSWPSPAPDHSSRFRSALLQAWSRTRAPGRISTGPCNGASRARAKPRQALRSFTDG